MLGLEFRPTFWINIYNRLRRLDFRETEPFKRNDNINQLNLQEIPKGLLSNISKDDNDKF